MNQVFSYRFFSAVKVLLVAASATLVACGDGTEGGGAPGAAGSDGGSDAGAANAGAAGEATSGGSSSSGGSPSVGGEGGALGEEPGEPTEEYTVSSFGYQDSHPAEFNPLNRAETTLLRREETSVFVPGSGNTFSGFALDDAGHAFTELGQNPAAALNGLALFDTAAENLDDDGHDELVAVGNAAEGLMVRVVDSGAGGLFQGVRDFTAAPAGYQHARLRLADIDNDGRAEILVTAEKPTGIVARLFDDAEHDFALIDELAAGAGQEISAAFGNFDDDAALELALLIDGGDSVRLDVKDDIASGFAALRSLTQLDLGLPASLVTRGLRLEIGNFDADARDELAVFAEGYDGSGNGDFQGLRAQYRDDAVAGYAALQHGVTEFGQPHPQGDYRYGNDWGWQTLAADTNGDGQEELFVLERVSGDTSFDWALQQLVFGKEAQRWTSASRFLRLEADVNGNSPATMVAAAGRSDSRGRDVIVTVRNDQNLTQHRVVAGTSNEKYQLTDSALPSRVVASTTAALWSAAGDYDQDSLRVRFTGEKWLELTRPRPIAILAAPPAKSGISQQYDNNSTSYSTSTSEENGTTEQYSITNKVTLSFEVSFPGLDFLSAGAHAEMSEQFSQSNTVTQSVTRGTSYAASYPDDVVVFNGTLCLRYEYVVLGGAEESLIGTKMTIDVPVDARIYKWTVEYYNESLDANGSPIGTYVLPQTAGDPMSFPSAEEAEALIAGRHDDAGNVAAWKSAAVSVGQGSGENSVWIELAKTVTNETSITTSTELGGSVGAFVSAEYSQGWDDTAAYSVSVSTSTAYQGVVGDIADENDYADFFYSFGLFVYPTKLQHGESVQVIQYWTEGFGPGYSN